LAHTSGKGVRQIFAWMTLGTFSDMMSHHLFPKGHAHGYP
jgi:hypothetical protein